MQKWTLHNRKKYSQKAIGKIKCPYCNGYYYKLASHTTQRHGVNAHALKIELNVPQSRGLLCEAKRQHLRDLVYKNKNKVIDTNLLQKGKATRMQKGNTKGRPKGKYSAIDTLFVTI